MKECVDLEEMNFQHTFKLLFATGQFRAQMFYWKTTNLIFRSS